MDIASTIEFFAMVRSGKDDLLVMRTAGYFDAKGSEIKQCAVVQTEDGKIEYRLKPLVEGEPYGQWIGLERRGKESILAWYANTLKVKLGDKIGLEAKPEEMIPPTEPSMDSNFEVGMEVLVKIKKKWVRSTVLNIGPSGITVSYPVGKKLKMETIPQKSASKRLNCVLDQSEEKKETVEGVPIPYSSVKTWFDSLVQPEDFTCCQDVTDRITFKIEENFAINLKKKCETRRYTGKVGHLYNQTFHIHDEYLGKIWIEFDLVDFFTWDFNLTDVEHELKVADNGQRSILFQVTHVWVDLNDYAMEFFNQDTMVCRKQIIRPWFISKWLIDNAITWALKSILVIGKKA